MTAESRELRGRTFTYVKPFFELCIIHFRLEESSAKIVESNVKLPGQCQDAGR
jgi:hypothetical protein